MCPTAPRAGIAEPGMASLLKPSPFCEESVVGKTRRLEEEEGEWRRREEDDDEEAPGINTCGRALHDAQAEIRSSRS